MPRNKSSFRGRNKQNNHSKSQNGSKAQKAHQQATKAGERGNYDSIPSENALFEKYYKESGVIPEEEWDEFWTSLKRTLPTTFRFTGSKGHALSVLKALKETYVPHLKGIEWDGEPVDPPAPLPWYPDELAWSLSVGKSTIRRCPPFKKFQNFLVAETTVGNISRQEAVSMIPPLMMDVEPHHTVLDMCAAPGSKTAQIIEAVHAGEESAVKAASSSASTEEMTEEGEVGGRATGLVIANDADYKRSHMLIHQTKRLNSPNLIVTNHDATAFPSLLISPPDAPRKEYLKFDRILADVPCSGDGTARKNYSVWRDWLPNSAFNLHLTQVRILVRGLQMLKVGGRLVYSTCSMNAVENESVLAAAIERCGGMDKVNLVDVSDRLPKLIRRPGLKAGWRIMDRDGIWYESYQEVLESPEEGRDARLARIVPSMFPTEGGKGDDDESRIPLERAMRVYPHLQDTGGFFIAVLEKKKEITEVKPEENGKERRRLAAMMSKQPKPAATPAAEEEVATPAEIQLPVPVTAEAPASPGKRKLEETEPEAEPAEKKARTSPEPITEAPAEVTEASTSTETPAASTPAKQAQANNPFRVNIKKGPPPEEPFKYLPTSHAVLQEIGNFYSLSPRFPRNCFMVRNAECNPARAIYFTSHLAKRVLEGNEGRGVKFVHCGVKAFMKQDTQSKETCPWRIQSEGLDIVVPWIGEDRVVKCRLRHTVHALLRELFPKVAEDTAEEADAKKEEEKGDGKGEEVLTIAEIREQVAKLSMGCCVLRVEATEGEKEGEEEGFKEEMILPLWKSRFSCNLMLPKDERKAMLLRLFDDHSEVKDSTNKNRVQDRPQKVEEATEVAEAVEEEKKEEVEAEKEVVKEEVGEATDVVMKDE